MTDSRAPYVLTVVVLALVVAGAWIGRDRWGPVTAGREAPAFAFPDLAGDTVSLADQRGRVVLVNVWATWCLPCREEMPSMERLYREMEGRDFEILAVSVDRPSRPGERAGPELRRRIRAFADSMGVTFPILHDPSGRIEELYRTTGVPESFVVGPDGIIYKKVAGATHWDAPQHRDLILRLLDGE